MRRYFQKNAWSSTTSDDLWATMSAVAGEDIVQMMSAFVNQPGLPLVSLSLEPDGRLHLRQERLHNLGDPARPGQWQVPVVLKWSRRGTMHEERVLLHATDTTVSLPGLADADWIYPNVGEAGYYRWSLSPVLHARLAPHAALLTPIERVGLLDNNSALFDAGLINGSDYLADLASFSRDLDPEVCGSVIEGINGLRDGFIPPPHQSAYHAFKRALLRPMLDRIKLQPVAGEPASHAPLRNDLFAALGYEVADPEVVAECRRQTALFLQDAPQVEPALRATVLSVAAYHGDAAFLAALQKTVERAPSPLVRSAAIRALGRFHDPVLARQALDWSLTPALNSTEFLNVADGMAADPALRGLVVAWIMDHYDTIAAKAASDYTAKLINYAGTTDRDLFNRLRDFLQAPARRTDYADGNIAKASDQLNLRLRLREKEQANIVNFLTSFPAGLGPKT
jgi:alanyl aminopeptidase